MSRRPFQEREQWRVGNKIAFVQSALGPSHLHYSIQNISPLHTLVLTILDFSVPQTPATSRERLELLLLFFLAFVILHFSRFARRRAGSTTECERLSFSSRKRLSYAREGNRFWSTLFLRLIAAGVAPCSTRLLKPCQSLLEPLSGVYTVRCLPGSPSCRTRRSSFSGGSCSRLSRLLLLRIRRGREIDIHIRLHNRDSVAGGDLQHIDYNTSYHCTRWR